MLGILSLFFFSACNPTKKLLPNEYIVDKVEVKNAKETNIPIENLEAFFRQKPNRKLARKIDFFVWWYNLFDEQKISERRLRRNLSYDKKNSDKVRRFEKKNEARAKKGKKPRVPKLKDKESPMMIESIRDIGEPAVIFDSTLTDQTRFQLSKYLFSKGYFNNHVSDSILIGKNSKRVTIHYILHPQKAYTVNTIKYDMEDKQLGELILRDTLNSLLKRGMQYDEEIFKAEQQRITEFALNKGYYYFENAYLNFYADTAHANHTVTLAMRLKKYSKPYNSSNDSMIYVNHPQFTIENVYIITDQVLGNMHDAVFKDTIRAKKNGLLFLVNKPLAYRQSLITTNTDIYKGQLYSKDTAQHTYKQLLGLGLFKNVTVKFYINENYPNRLDCYIMCNPLIKQSLTAETEGTNTSGNLGIDGSLVYQNRSTFKGGELLEIKIQGAVAAQKQLSKDTSYINSVNDITDFKNLQQTFSTIQFGPQLSFSVPRAFFPFSLLPFHKDQLPRTYIKSSLNYQSSPLFSRIITNINYGFSFRTHGGRLKHDFIPFEAYLVNAKLVKSYKDTLEKLQDAFILNSFQDHITTLSKYGLTYTSRENSTTGQRTAYFVKFNLQSSGNLLRQLYIVSGQKPDSAGHYELFKIPFAQFVKTDIDMRVYVPIRKKSRMVYRIAGGIGKPLTNLGVLPYEQSFFSGGPNGVRAWRARTLGPGSYDPSKSQTRYDKIGDILLEGNIEYRFHIIKTFHGAFFVDAGNIWRLQPDKNKPGAEFIASKFLDQIAIGGGFGLRWDLTFFVLRLDLAAPLKDPKFAQGNRWTFDKQPWQYTVANFGIGYPF